MIKRHIFHRIISLIWQSGLDFANTSKYFEAMRLLAKYLISILHRSFDMYIASEDTAKIHYIPREAAGIPIRSMGLTQLPV
jgi:hypothetical protein